MIVMMNINAVYSHVKLSEVKKVAKVTESLVFSDSDQKHRSIKVSKLEASESSESSEVSETLEILTILLPLLLFSLLITLHDYIQH